MFEQLPHELLKLIIGEISIKDVKNLSQTSKHFHSSTLPTVWASVVIPAGKAAHMIEGYKPVKKQMVRLLPTAIHEEADRTKPSWGLGTCIPTPILGSNGIVARQQSSLRTLNLTTYPFCQRYSSRERKIDLSAFRHLLNLSWRGLSSDKLRVFATGLKNNKSHLETLELDLVDWPHLRKALGYWNDNERVRRMRARNCMNKMILGLDIHSPHITFPNLHTLVLSHVPLTATLVQSINFEVLRSLTIRSCPQWYDFVLAITRQRIPERLKKLELQESWPKNDAATDEFEDGDPSEVLLEYFQGAGRALS
ncbi:hypothetical protein FVEG_17571 [Fusarium verticillioides 7600]|uniref:F-box domain-containing protein n=1 Tax=Gibberella moniliformis (strain M3125 / FGSC 7600) TaxID=334819 RepID=W7MWL2_GIBM7|nr:hypothetical protein FVEG_17571 [Fusarium verticillioides 7600]EWG55688.1 hypothetical protein FVEG_17571 [Fusarium verticillioides 7600]